MVEISKSGSGEGLGWATGRGYSTFHRYDNGSSLGFCIRRIGIHLYPSAVKCL